MLDKTKVGVDSCGGLFGDCHKMRLTSEFIEFGSTYNKIVAGGAESNFFCNSIQKILGFGQGWILQLLEAYCWQLAMRMAAVVLI